MRPKHKIFTTYCLVFLELIHHLRSSSWVNSLVWISARLRALYLLPLISRVQAATGVPISVFQSKLRKIARHHPFRSVVLCATRSATWATAADPFATRHARLIQRRAEVFSASVKIKRAQSTSRTSPWTESQARTSTTAMHICPWFSQSYQWPQISSCLSASICMRTLILLLKMNSATTPGLLLSRTCPLSSTSSTRITLSMTLISSSMTIMTSFSEKPFWLLRFSDSRLSDIFSQ